MADQDLELRRAGDGGRTGRGRFFFFLLALPAFLPSASFLVLPKIREAGALDPPLRTVG